jgi:hypothetical protein
MTNIKQLHALLDMPQNVVPWPCPLGPAVPLTCVLLLVLQVSRVSLLYETAPMYVTEQPAFLNAAVLGRTDLPPLQLLYHCKQIEKQAGEACRTSSASAVPHLEEHCKCSASAKPGAAVPVQCLSDTESSSASAVHCHVGAAQCVVGATARQTPCSIEKNKLRRESDLHQQRSPFNHT